MPKPRTPISLGVKRLHPDAIRFDKKTNRLHPIDPLDTTDTKGEEDACPF